jgi:DNA modification methylase
MDGLDAPKFGRPLFGVDCLDPDLGLPRLAREIRLGRRERIDLCLTDPPYNLGAGPHSQADSKRGEGSGVEKVDYVDKMDPGRYEIFSNAWFYWAKRVAKMVVFTPGDPNLKMWLNIEEPKDLFVVFKPNGQGKTYLASKNRLEHLLFYGDYPRSFLFPSNTVRVVVNSGFLRAREFISNHPHQKPLALYEYILERIRPKTVVDPFFGSGTSGEAALRRGVPFLAYELEESYRASWGRREKRAKRIGRKKGQKRMDAFMTG